MPPRSPTAVLRHLPVAAALLGTTCLAGCGDASAMRPGDVRRYTIPKPAAPPAPVAATASPEAARLRYEVPDGWSDRGSSGMRLATLTIGDPAAGREVTVIPASGTLEGNVDRWQGQLGDADPAVRAKAVETALGAAEKVTVDGVEGTIVLLVDTAAAAGPDAAGEAILGAMIPIDDAGALFVKFKGDAAVARRERENFRRFVASIRWK